MSGVENHNEAQQAAMQAFALRLPQVVFNSFANAFSPSEITSTVSFGAQPLVQLIMAPVVAKSFALELLNTVEQYEQASGTEVLTIQEVTARITANRGAPR
jgi:hypothetical protein